MSVAHLIDESTHPGAGRQQEQSVREEDEVALSELLRNNRKQEVIFIIRHQFYMPRFSQQASVF